MCGILGIISRAGSKIREINYSDVESGIFNRGTSILEYNNTDLGCAFVFSRLPTDGSNNFNFSSNDDLLLFNGLIYNVKELCKHFSLPDNCQKSDYLCLKEGISKVGQAFFDYCDGMFAGVYLSKTQKIIFRDSVGIKPLYYSELKDGNILVSSLINPFYHFDCQTINELVPGSVIKICTAQGKNIVEEIKLKKTEIDLDQYLHDRVYGSANRYLNTFKDKSIAVLLSGGLDSIIILNYLLTGLDPRNLKRIKVFTIGSKGSEDLDASLKVMKWANEEFGTIDHIICEPPSREWLTELISTVIKKLGSFNPRDIYVSILNEILAQAINSEDIHVAYSGQGSDELFLGYQIDLLSKWPNLTADNIKFLHNTFRTKVFPETLLLRDDRIFSSYRIELRAPFSLPKIQLSPKIFWKKNIQTKYDLAEFAKDCLEIPSSLSSRPKQRMIDGVIDSNKACKTDIINFDNSKLINELTGKEDICYFKEVYLQHFNGKFLNRSGITEQQFLDIITSLQLA